VGGGGEEGGECNSLHGRLFSLVEMERWSGVGADARVR